MTRIRKILTGGLAALTISATIAATSTPAAAFGGWGYGGGWHGGGWHGGGWGPGALAAGAIGGLALGAVAAGAAGAYGPGYGYGCVANQPVYDPYGNFAGYRRARVAC